MSEIRLISPEDGATTEPLQAYPWPPESTDADPRAAAAPIEWNHLEISSEDRTLPRPISLAWEPVGAGRGELLYDVFISRNAEMDDPTALRDVGKPRVGLVHLHLGTPYHWQVLARRDGECVAASPVSSFTTNPAPPRWIHVPGMTNVRDIGGWPLPGGGTVRQGVVYRSSEMNVHLEIADAGRRTLLDKLRIRTDLDLRRPEDGACPALDEGRVEWIDAPVAAYGQINDAMSRDGLRRVFAVFADPARHPVLFHCWGGCDRGGTVAFLLNALLGVEFEFLARDYELSSLSIWGERSRHSADFRTLLDLLAPFAAESGDLRSQAEGFLLQIGVPAQHIEAIRRELIVKPDAA